jgi:hypothetical protein
MPLVMPAYTLSMCLPTHPQYVLTHSPPIWPLLCTHQCPVHLWSPHMCLPLYYVPAPTIIHTCHLCPCTPTAPAHSRSQLRQHLPALAHQHPPSFVPTRTCHTCPLSFATAPTVVCVFTCTHLLSFAPAPACSCSPVCLFTLTCTLAPACSHSRLHPPTHTYCCLCPHTHLPALVCACTCLFLLTCACMFVCTHLHACTCPLSFMTAPTHWHPPLFACTHLHLLVAFVCTCCHCLSNV